MLGAMFDAPIADKCRIEYKIELPIEGEPWNVGLVVGPSGSGKSTVMRHLWGDMCDLEWSRGAVVDDFAKGLSMDDISRVCSAVGFNTIPAWMRPFSVLSNGERFRVDLARRMLELPDPVVVDEFTSVVDRQVAQIGSHAVQKYVRRNKRHFVAITCHYDVIDWLQPDWVLDMATRSFTRRCLQRRPEIECVIGRLPYSAWAMFAPYHYMSAKLHRAARCFGLWANGRLAAFSATLHRPHPKVRDIIAVTRGVTLPDWQGIGCMPVLNDTLGSAYAGIGKRLRLYPVHPANVRTYDKSSNWRMTERGGDRWSSTRTNGKSTLRKPGKEHARMGDRPCTIFEWAGPVMAERDARRLLGIA